MIKGSCRKQFEAWFVEQYRWSLRRERKLAFRYEATETQLSWIAWMNGWLAGMAEKDSKKAILEDRRRAIP